MSAYNLCKEISLCRDNFSREKYVLSKLGKISRQIGRQLIVQKLPIPGKFGSNNLILDSGKRRVFLVTAHYDSFILGGRGRFTSPGANDDGSGVSVLLESIEALKDMPVDFVVFGGEEKGCVGSKEYITQYVKTGRKKIEGLVNLDTCGSGGSCGILIPQEVYVGRKIFKINDEINNFFLKIARSKNYRVCNKDPLATGDHGPFIKLGIPATTLQGEDCEYFGLKKGEYVKNKRIMHTKKDTITWVDEEFLERIKEILVRGTVEFCKEKIINKKMNLLVLYGPPAVGKFSVAEEISKLTGYRNFHNHLTIEMARLLFGFGNKKFYEYSDQLTFDFINLAGKEGIDLIYTLCYSFPEDLAFVRKLKRIVRSNSGKIFFVHLVASPRRLIRRVSTPMRKGYGKLVSKGALRDLLTKKNFFRSIEGGKNLRIDNTSKSVKEVAAKIITHYGIGRQSF